MNNQLSPGAWVAAQLREVESIRLRGQILGLEQARSDLVDIEREIGVDLTNEKADLGQQLDALEGFSHA